MGGSLMSLRLYFHPLSSFCQKVLTALYENDTPFEREVVNLMDPDGNAAFRKLWPIGKFPVLRDEARNKIVPESTTVIEYLDRHFPGPSRLIPADPDAAEETRFLDRIFDLYVHLPMQKIVTDRMRPQGRSDAYGVEHAKEQIATAYGILEERLAGREWANGAGFSMADCAAAAPLTFADMQVPIGARKNLAGYLVRLKARPSFARTWKEAEPYLAMVPK
jgi:glutathione S-transferase